MQAISKKSMRAGLDFRFDSINLDVNIPFIRPLTAFRDWSGAFACCQPIFAPRWDKPGTMLVPAFDHAARLWKANW